MLERRKAGPRPAPLSPSSRADVLSAPDSFGNSSASAPSSSDSASAPSASPWVVWEHHTATTATASVQDEQDDQAQGEDEQDGQTSIPVTADHSASTPSPSSPSSAPAAPLVEFARRVAAEHHTQHGRPITRDALRARLGISNQLASDLLRQLRTEHNGTEHHSHATAPVA